MDWISRNVPLKITKEELNGKKMTVISRAEKVKTYTIEEVISILTDIQLEIEEKFNDRPFSYNHHQRTEFYRDIDEVIQQKINSLKE